MRIRRSKSLPQSDVELSSPHSRYRVQVSPDIKANWPHRGRIPYPHPHRIRVVLDKMANTNWAVDVAPVVENGCAKSLFDSQGKTEFGIKHEQLIASDGYPQVHARRGNAGIAASGHRALRASSVDREAAERGLASGKETLARRHVTARERFCQPQSNPVRPYSLAERLVVGTLAQEAREVGVGAQSLLGDSQVHRLIETAAGIEGLVTGVANPGSGER